MQSAAGTRAEYGTSEPWARRDVLKALGLGVMAGALDACRVAPSRPLPGCAGPGPSPHRHLDAHIHIFNGTDLQIAGFLREAVAPEYPSVARLIGLIAEPLQTFVWAVSPQAIPELEHLNGLATASGVRSFAETTFAKAFERDRAQTGAQYSEFLRQQFQRDDVRSELSRLVAEQQARGAARGVPRSFGAPRDASSARSLAREVDLASGIPFFDYLEPYFSYRYANFFEAADQFTCHGRPTIDSFVALLVDFDEPLAPGKETPSRISDQAVVVSRICQLSQGRLLALAPYCPIKDVARQGASLKNVLAAWARPGFVGAKLYPPMGFKAYGNGDARDGALARFYHECIVHDAVVMAHAGPSLCVHSGPCTEPGFEGWSAALEHVFAKEKAPLRAALGHFGDVLGSKPESVIWPEAFQGLMQRPSGQHLYGDLSYASETLKSSNDQKVIDRLSGLIKSPGSVLAERLMYGSDWLMLGLESKWRDYSTRMESVIRRVESATGTHGFEDRFFGGNARAWLGLDQVDSLASKSLTALSTGGP